MLNSKLRRDILIAIQILTADNLWVRWADVRKYMILAGTATNRQLPSTVVKALRQRDLIQAWDTGYYIDVALTDWGREEIEEWIED
jgi:hypothetical protein